MPFVSLDNHARAENEKLWRGIKARIVKRMRSPEYATRNHQRSGCESVEAWQEDVTDLERQGDLSDFWAGEPEIAAAEEVLDVLIHVYQTLGEEASWGGSEGRIPARPAWRTARRFGCGTR